MTGKNKPCKCGHKTTKCDCADIGIFTCSCKCDCKKKENKSHIRWGTSSFIRMVESEK